MTTDFTRVDEEPESGIQGALPTLHNNDAVLGVPGSKVRAKSNVGRLAVLGIMIAAFLFVVAGLMIYQKHRRSSTQVAVEKIKETPSFAVKNEAVESISMASKKAAIKKAEEEAVARRKAAEEAMAAEAAKRAAAGTTGIVTPLPVPKVSVSGVTGQIPLTLEEQQLAGNVLLDNTGNRSIPKLGGTSSGQLSEGEVQQREVAVRLAAMGRNPDGTLKSGLGSAAGLAVGSGGSASALSERLEPSVLQARAASRLPTLDYLLKKGTTIPCALKTGIDTTLPGFVICSVVNDVYSANGKTLLVERGATIFGEQQSSLKQGQERTFVVWSRIDNPSGIFANVDSPAADQMGYSGIPGYVNTHFWQRFGGAIMLSLISDFSAAYSQRLASTSDSNGSNNITYQQPFQNTQQTTQNMAAEALRNSINIPPALTVLPGKVVNVLVARDVSFENVYQLVE